MTQPLRLSSHATSYKRELVELRHAPNAAHHPLTPGPSPASRARGVLGIRSALALWLLALTFFAGAASGADRFAPLEPRQVKVAGEIGRRIDVTVQNNLLQLKVDQDFLKPFQDGKYSGAFIGLGMLIDATVRLAAYTDNAKVLELKKHLVHETIKAQQPDGYLGTMAPKNRMWKLWDIHEMGYIVYGLTSDYRFFREKPSLEAACKLANYILRRWQAEPQGDPSEGSITVHMAVTGLERSFLTLTAVTGDRRYHDFCVRERKLREWDLDIVRGRWGKIEGHAYAYFGHALAQLQLYRQEPDEKLLGQARRALDFLTRRNGLVISGACGDHECWHDTQSGMTNLGETCATAYLLRVLDDLLRLEGDARYGDIMERSILNALFAAQSPDGRQLRYYAPFECKRAYWSGDTYCCPNNYRRIVSELPAMVYYREPRGLVVNLYTASQARLELDRGLTLAVRQETDYPNSGRVALSLQPSKPAQFSLKLRIPRWCQGARLTVNGEAVKTPAARGSFAVIERAWQPGDRVVLDMPMPWRLVKGRQSQAGRVAVMRGPMVFCVARSHNKALDGVDLRLLTASPSSLAGPSPDHSVRPDGLAASLQAWKPGAWYPSARPDYRLVLTEFADPDAEFAYFHVPNPSAKELVDDELLEQGVQ